MFTFFEKLGIFSSFLYLLGGILFVLGSIYIVGSWKPLLCFDPPTCDFDVGIWYLIGCIFYWFAATIDIYIAYRVLHKISHRRSNNKRKRNFFTICCESKEDLFVTWMYLIGSILFLLGSVFFLLKMNFIGRQVYRIGSCTYLLGSLYGVFRIVKPKEFCYRSSSRIVRRKTMTQYELVSTGTSSPANPFSSSSSRVSEELDLVGDSTTKKLSVGNYNKNVIKLAIMIKFVFIGGSICFLLGGIFFDYELNESGGYIWFFGSILFCIGSTISLIDLYLSNKSNLDNSKKRSSSITTGMFLDDDRNQIFEKTSENFPDLKKGTINPKYVVDNNNDDGKCVNVDMNTTVSPHTSWESSESV